MVLDSRNSFSILSLLGAIGALTIGLVTGGVGGMIFWGLMLYYLTRTHARAFLGKGGLHVGPTCGLPYSLAPQENQPQIATYSLRSTIGRRFARRYSAHLTRIIKEHSYAKPELVYSCIVQLVKRWQGTSMSLLSHYTSDGTKKCLTCGEPIQLIFVVRKSSRML